MSFGLEISITIRFVLVLNSKRKEEVAIEQGGWVF